MLGIMVQFLFDLVSVCFVLLNQYSSSKHKKNNNINLQFQYAQCCFAAILYLLCNALPII